MQHGRSRGSEPSKKRARSWGRGSSLDKKPKDAHPPLETASVPRTIDVVEFAKARAEEIKDLKSAVDSLSGSHRVFQLLPRHLRRRTMSHNIHRLPVHLRKAAAKEKSKMEKNSAEQKPNRRKRRKPKASLQDYERRQRKHKWLETHIWHAKRMHMANLWGYRLSERPTAKSVRATYKASLHLCTAFDASFINAIEVEGTQDSIAEALQPFLPERHLLLNDMYTAGCREGSLHLLHPNSRHLLGVVRFCWRPQAPEHQGRSLWLWVHACIFDFALSLLQASTADRTAVSVRDLSQQLLRFEVRGSRCQAVLASCLRSIEADTTWDTICQHVRTPASLPAESIIMMEAKDMRRVSPQQTFDASALVVKDKPADQGGREQKPAATMTKTAPLPHDMSCSKAHALLQSWPAPPPSPSRLWEEASRKAMHSTAQTPVQTKAEAMKAALSPRAAPVAVMLVQRPGGVRGKGSGWDIILPGGWGLHFWKALVFAGARVIGLKDRRRCNFEHGLLTFPEDYPECVAGALYENYVAGREKMHYLRKPRAKRVHFGKYGVSYPFGPGWHALTGRAPSSGETLFRSAECQHTLRAEEKEEDQDMWRVAPDTPSPEISVLRDRLDQLSAGVMSLQVEEKKKIANAQPTALLPVRVHMPRSYPVHSAMIVCPTRSDFQSWLHCPPAQKWHLQQPLLKGAEAVTSPPSSAVLRQTMGYITYGVNSFGHGHGYGTGLCRLADYQSLWRMQAEVLQDSSDHIKSLGPHQVFVLVRNPQSLFYFPALLCVSQSEA